MYKHTQMYVTMKSRSWIRHMWGGWSEGWEGGEGYCNFKNKRNKRNTC